jgi:hypothetical protein
MPLGEGGGRITIRRSPGDPAGRPYTWTMLADDPDRNLARKG